MGAFAGFMFGLGVLLLALAKKAESTLPVWSLPVNVRMRRRRLLVESAVGLSSRQLWCAQFGVACLVGLTIFAVSRTVVIASCFALFGFRAPMAVVHRLRRRRRAELREVWPEVVDNLASAVRAGLSLPEALAALAVRGPLPLRSDFADFAREYRAHGRFIPCLDRLKTRLADPVGDRICETLRVAREVGGSDLGRVLRTLSSFLRADARARSELEARQSWTTNGAKLAVAAPWAVLLLLATQLSTLDAYDSLAGAVLLVTGAAVCFSAYRLMLRIGRLPQEERVLR